MLIMAVTKTISLIKREESNLVTEKTNLAPICFFFASLPEPILGLMAVYAIEQRHFALRIWFKFLGAEFFFSVFASGTTAG